MDERQRVEEGVRDNPEDVLEVVFAALRLERALYSREEYGPFLFRLRKSLEGIWGHDLPELDQFGKEIV